MSDEKMVDLTPEEIKARERAVAEDVAKRNAEPAKDPEPAKDKTRFSTTDK